MSFTRENEEADQQFEAQINFYTSLKAKAQATTEQYEQVLNSCNPSNMFEGLQEMLENNQEQSANMPVRKFYKNTFGDLLNRAIFALTKKQG